MKTCPVCNEIYNNSEQNYCLNDGAVLEKTGTDAATSFMDPPRVTNPNWQSDELLNWNNPEPVSHWQNQPNLQKPPFAPPALTMQKQYQTLPTVSLVLGIMSFVVICCYGGFPLGIAALVTGYLGMKNADNDPMNYGGRGMAIAGLILGAVSVISSVVFIIFVFLLR